MRARPAKPASSAAPAISRSHASRSTSAGKRETCSTTPRGKCALDGWRLVGSGRRGGGARRASAGGASLSGRRRRRPSPRRRAATGPRPGRELARRGRAPAPGGRARRCAHGIRRQGCRGRRRRRAARPRAPRRASRVAGRRRCRGCRRPSSGGGAAARRRSARGGRRPRPRRRGRAHRCRRRRAGRPTRRSRRRDSERRPTSTCRPPRRRRARRAPGPAGGHGRRAWWPTRIRRSVRATARRTAERGPDGAAVGVLDDAPLVGERAHDAQPAPTGPPRRGRRRTGHGGPPPSETSTSTTLFLTFQCTRIAPSASGRACRIALATSSLTTISDSSMTGAETPRATRSSTSSRRMRGAADGAHGRRSVRFSPSGAPDVAAAGRPCGHGPALGRRGVARDRGGARACGASSLTRHHG